MSGTRAARARRGSTFLEVAATLTIVALFTGLVVYSSKPFDTVAGDTQAKARLQQSLALVDAARTGNAGSLTGLSIDVLSQRSDGFTFVASTTAATANTVSLATSVSATSQKVSVATLTPTGECWYASADYQASLVANAPLVIAVRPASGTSACTGAVAAAQLPVGTQGRSWDLPVTVS